MTIPSKKLFQSAKATELTTLRIQKRRKHRLTYDCLNGIVVGNSVACKKGHTFPSIGNRQEAGLAVRTVLSGRSSSACHECDDYDGEENE